MGEQANVKSIEAIGELRGRFVSTGESIRRILDECLGEVRRTMTWVEGPQLEHWKREARKREQKAASARSDLERAKISKPDADPRSFVDQTRALKRAKDALDEAHMKVRAIKRWARELQRHYMLFQGGIRPLATAAEVDMPKAGNWLRSLEQHLTGYLQVMPPMPEAELTPAPDGKSYKRAAAEQVDAPDESEDQP